MLFVSSSWFRGTDIHLQDRGRTQTVNMSEALWHCCINDRHTCAVVVLTSWFIKTVLLVFCSSLNLTNLCKTLMCSSSFFLHNEWVIVIVLMGFPAVTSLFIVSDGVILLYPSRWRLPYKVYETSITHFHCMAIKCLILVCCLIDLFMILLLL